MLRCMLRLHVQSTDIPAVNEFDYAVNSFPYDVDLSSGRYVVDAKSIMGIFSLELQRPINIEIHSDHCEDLVKELEPYLSLIHISEPTRRTPISYAVFCL